MQEKLFKDHVVSKYNQMLYINIISAIITLFAMVTTHSLQDARNFCALHPAIIVDIAELCIAACAGQWFIYTLLKDFGALVLATVLAVRQVLSTLISYAYYRHQITTLQAAALTLVFGALLFRSFLRFAGQREREEKSQLLPDRFDIKCQRDAASSFAKV
mmetsp:Transcript_66140/g.149293  ORF Transcript_66140/g.149293 Transcript_66140/m.149293 type:complete len:160 (+) Transcript_66140:2-481(+)